MSLLILFLIINFIDSDIDFSMENMLLGIHRIRRPLVVSTCDKLHLHIILCVDLKHICPIHSSQ